MSKLLKKIVLMVFSVLGIVAFILIILPFIRPSRGGRMKCATAYDCKSNGNGTANCLYDNGEGTIEEVICNYED